VRLVPRRWAVFLVVVVCDRPHWMVSSESALAGEAPPVTRTWTCRPQAEELVIRTASWALAWVAAAMAG